MALLDDQRYADQSSAAITEVVTAVREHAALTP